MRPVAAIVALVLLVPSVLADGFGFGPETIADVAQAVSPSVVNIAVAARTAAGAGAGRPWQRWRSQRESLGEGSGFFVDSQGRLLTNHHVIEGGASFDVTLWDGRRFAATLVAADPQTDLAMLRLADEDFKPPLPAPCVARLGNSDKLRVGQWVVAIGSPYSLQRTVTAGIISALGRHIPTSESQRYNNLIQTDASINPGNSGGPLVDLQGFVIGVNAAVRVQGQGLGFAIPVNLVRKIRDDFVAVGRVRRSWLGITFDPMTNALARGLKLPRPYGVIVKEVAAGSPAADATLQAGDVILSVDGHAIENHSQLIEQVQETPVGERVTMSVLRTGERLSLPVRIQERGGE